MSFVLLPCATHAWLSSVRTCACVFVFFSRRAHMRTTSPALAAVALLVPGCAALQSDSPLCNACEIAVGVIHGTNTRASLLEVQQAMENMCTQWLQADLASSCSSFAEVIAADMWLAVTGNATKTQVCMLCVCMSDKCVIFFVAGVADLPQAWDVFLGRLGRKCFESICSRFGSSIKHN